MDKDTWMTLTMLAICGFVAYRLVRWLWPIAEQRKNLTPLQMVERAIQVPVEEQQRQATKYGTRKKTLVIHAVNFALLLAWMRFGAGSPAVFWGVLAYLVIGFLMLRSLRVPPASDLEALNLNERLWLRVFHAWLWPAYLMYILGRR